MSFCELIVDAHRDKKTLSTLTDVSKQTTIKQETIDSEEDQQQQQPKPLQSGSASSLASGRSSLSWHDQVIKEEEEDSLRAKSSNPDMLAGSDSQMSLDEGNTSGSRQIEIDILDSANVEKYEKLIRCDKIKSPFKRRLSGGGDEDDDDDEGQARNDGHAQFDSGFQRGPNSRRHMENIHKRSKTHEDDHGRERYRRESTDSGDGSSQSSRRPVEYEKDIEILVRRQKQIDYGKNTLGYENYLRQVPKEKRAKEHPKTPPKHIKYSRRAWDGLVKVWRKKLHCFDPDARPDNNDAADDN